MLKVVDLKYFDQPSYIWVKFLFWTYSMFFVLSNCKVLLRYVENCEFAIF